MTATVPVGRVRLVLQRRRARRLVSTYPVWCSAGAAIFAGAVIALVVSLASDSAQAFGHSGFGFLWSRTWNPAANQYGAGILVVGTLLTTAVALVLAVPVGLGAATFLSELCPPWLAAPLSAGIDFLAAVPSIVVGLWALLVLSPVFRSDVEPFLRSVPGLDALFRGPSLGPSVLLASLVLAVMILPTLVALSRTALAGVARSEREAAMAMGATRWQVVRSAVMPAAGSGIVAAITLAVGRALGESIAVAMVIGNRPAIPHSLSAPAATLGTAIVNQFAEATPGLASSSVIALGAVLLLLTVAVNMGGQALLRRQALLRPSPAAGPPTVTEVRPVTAALPEEPAISDVEVLRATARASASRSLPWRRRRGVLAECVCVAAVLLGLAPLVALLYYTVARGASSISVAFLTHGP